MPLLLLSVLVPEKSDAGSRAHPSVPVDGKLQLAHVPQINVCAAAQHEPAVQVPPLQECPHVPQLVPLVIRLTQAPLQPDCPLPQQVLPEQFPFAHWILLWQLPPSVILVAQAPALQYSPMVPQLVVVDMVHAPALLQAVADEAMLRSAEQLAPEQLVVEPGYEHASDDPSQ